MENCDREKIIQILSKDVFVDKNVNPIEALTDYLIDNGVTFQTKEIITNYDRIKQMSIEEMSSIMGFYVWEESCFYKWFNKEKCENCKNIEVQINGKTQKWKECEFDGICPLFESEKDIIKLWLEQEVES